ncbi:class I SAM-dependent methyltransferase [Ornithinimicrobium sp. INDO-MA30-4]|uniref:class I SAM-dependent methyltransferase n=1 Tax=Ornithinimicrobium sp. INDO-MA30-4 TaxID=2908651 RepID=UPI001F181B0C|nr:class I SAM-dependent methyltransferase [Ornithinimicrobium sp. INDO-MA30-4]UJH70870.1 hypothetical protein L0A91_02420 [Ornithinimicrobium sp. INDO-MA30-4]
MSDEEIQSDPIAADWLELRRPLDDQARRSTVEALGQLIAQCGPISSVIDVGAGTGANTAWLAHHLEAMGEAPQWILLDHDPNLLANIDLPARLPFPPWLATSPMWPGSSLRAPRPASSGHLPSSMCSPSSPSTPSWVRSASTPTRRFWRLA